MDIIWSFYGVLMEFLWSSYLVPSGQRRGKVGRRSGEGRENISYPEVKNVVFKFFIAWF
jgi:hypothetical protein